MDLSRLIELGPTAVLGLFGMWLMFKLCKHTLTEQASAIQGALSQQTKIMQQLAAEIKADREAAMTEHHIIMEEIKDTRKAVYHQRTGTGG